MNDTLCITDVTERFFTFLTLSVTFKVQTIERTDENESEKSFINRSRLACRVFVLWTILIMSVDVQNVGQQGTAVGFAAFNTWFHRLIGGHMRLYVITDWLGLVPIAVCMGFGVLGLTQLIRCRSLFKVDPDIIILGIYYIICVLQY